MPTIVIYGALDCDDTQRTRNYLTVHNIPFDEVDIAQDAQAEQFVIFINRGYRSTPTLVIGEGQRKLILTEPSDEQLAAELA
jgi:mycoredoxin